MLIDKMIEGNYYELELGDGFSNFTVYCRLLHKLDGYIVIYVYKDFDDRKNVGKWNKTELSISINDVYKIKSINIQEILPYAL
jgi:hypothetical protein